MSIIAISRGTFSGGQELAELLAERLGYQCLSREVVLDAAATYGVPVEKFIEAMERPPSLWERLTGERSDYLHYLRAAMVERAQAGKLVYHGYAGHLLLPGISHVIRVRVVADMEARIATAMERRALNWKDAEEHIRRIDRQRADWTRFIYGVDWRDASLYDLVLNVTTLGVPFACDLIARVTELDSFKPTAESMGALRDLAIASRVWIRLAIHEETLASRLEVIAREGVVTISGTVVDWETIEAISRVARQVEGVREVRSDVRVSTLRENPL